AIASYEAAATKTKSELVAKVDGASSSLATSFDTIGTSFDTVVAQETTKLEATLAEYTQKTAAIPESFKTQLAAKLEIIGGNLQTQIDGALKGEGLKEGLRKKAEPEIKKAIGQGPKDAQILWKA